METSQSQISVHGKGLVIQVVDFQIHQGLFRSVGFKGSYDADNLSGAVWKQRVSSMSPPFCTQKVGSFIKVEPPLIATYCNGPPPRCRGTEWLHLLKAPCTRELHGEGVGTAGKEGSEV